MKFENDFDRGFFLGINHGKMGVNLLLDDKIFRDANRCLAFWQAYEVSNVYGTNYREGFLKGLFDLALTTGYNKERIEEFYNKGYDDAYYSLDGDVEQESYEQE